MVEKKTDTINFNFHSTLKKMYFHPKNFFKDSEKENSYQSLLRMFVLFYVFYLLIFSGINLYFGNLNIFNATIGFIVGILFAVILAFVFSGIMHFILIIISGNKPYFKTYKSGIYTLILWVLYSVILLIVSLIIPFDSQGLQVALTNNQDYNGIGTVGINFLTNNPASLISLLISFLFYVHILVFGIKALSNFQKISLWKSTFVIVLTTLVLFAMQIIVSVFAYTRTSVS